MGFSFIHMADVHLDTPFASRMPEVRSLLRECILRAFERAVDIALSEHVNAVLIAGDLFDSDTLSFATEKFLLDQLHRLAKGGVKVFYAPGNHDPFGAGFRIAKIPWPDNVYIFNSVRPQSLPLTDGEGRTIAIVVGAGHESSRESRNLAAGFPQADSWQVPYIGLLHTMVCGAAHEGQHEKYAPCTVEDLENKGYTYWALGHIHARGEISGNVMAVYPGNISGRNPREEGLKGIYRVKINDQGNVDATFYPVSPVCWKTISTGGLEQIINAQQLEDHICRVVDEELAKQQGGIIYLVRIKLEGPCPLYEELLKEENIYDLEEEVQKILGLKYVEVDCTGVVRPVNVDKYRGGSHLLGMILDILDLLKENDELLLKVKPYVLAGCPSRKKQEVLRYLRGLLNGMDREVAARMIEVEEYEI